MQDVFIKVFRAKLPAEETFLAWFYRVILNTGRDHGRRRKTRHGLVGRLQKTATEAVVPEPAAPADAALGRALAGLPEDLRECVALRYFVDLPLEEIARAQDVPVGTVKSRLHSAMKRLRRTLDERGYERET